MRIPFLADRAWHAYHCLPRDKTGKLPSYRQIGRAHGLSPGVISRMMLGTRTKIWPQTLLKMAGALGCTVEFLTTGNGRAPRLPPGTSIPPRPRTEWKQHRDVPGWAEAVAEARKRSDLPIPPAAFLAGAKLPVYRPVAAITPDLAIFVSGYAYATAKPPQQTRRGGAAKRLRGEDAT